MSGSRGRGFYDLEIDQRYERLSTMLWDAVDVWSERHQRHPGRQMLEAVDSIGSNIAESVGRGHFGESQHFLLYARGSMTETQHWIRTAVRRRLFADALIPQLREESMSLHAQLNAFINAQRPLNRPARAAMPLGAKGTQESVLGYGALRRKAKSQEPRAKSEDATSALGEPF
ncbi:MAG TPA: four helix bundle protein [Planctomycetota bacterium]|jgi:four helix bundle protein